jgi:pilus assembly protein TadC
MLVLGLLCIFLAVTIFILGLMPKSFDSRPKLNMDPVPGEIGGTPQPPKKKSFGRVVLERMSIFNKPLAVGPFGQRMTRDINMAQVNLTAEEFLLMKELLILGLLAFVMLVIVPEPGMMFFYVTMAVVAGYFLPELWLKGRAAKIRDSILRDLPDTVDLLGLCVNAGLDFMMALKYVVEKSAPSVIIEELRAMMQEINVGKPRRDALRDMARKYELPDLSTFARTLIQADRMGTSVTEALNILSEDMREARFRRGEAMALKAPLKMLIPLLLCIFPVVAILVAGPVILDFLQNNPLQGIGK